MNISTGTHSIDLPPPNHPGQIYYAPRQHVRANQVTQTSDDQIVIGVTWNTLTKSEMDSITGFIRTFLMYSTNTCRIENLLGRDYSSLRYVRGMDTARARKGDLWSISLRFEQVPDETLPLNQNLVANPNLKVNPDGETIDGWGIFNSVAYKHDTPDTTPAGLTSSQTTRPTADGIKVADVLSVTENDRDNEKIITSKKIPITDYQHTVSARMYRRSGTRSCSLFVSFFQGNNEFFAHSQRTGWVSSDDPFFVFGQKTPQDENSEWGLYSITFGPGNNVYVPPQVDSFKIGVFIAQAGDAPEPFAIILYVADFSVVVSP